MEKTENKIIFREVKNYEKAYYYNSDLENSERYNNYHKNNKKKSKLNKSLFEFIGVIFEGILEIIFSIVE